MERLLVHDSFGSLFKVFLGRFMTLLIADSREMTGKERWGLTCNKGPGWARNRDVVVHGRGAPTRPSVLSQDLNLRAFQAL